MSVYEDLLANILKNGKRREDRTGTGTLSVFGLQFKYDLSKGFPLITTKKLHVKSIVHELLWMLNGDTNIKYLNDNGVTIWDEWADDNGDLGPIYGHQWRKWRGNLISLEAEPTFADSKYMNFKAKATFEDIDQIKEVINSLRYNPYSRRHIVSAWNPAEVKNMALPPCHCLFQFYAEKLDIEERYPIYKDMQSRNELQPITVGWNPNEHSDSENLDNAGVPKFRLSCKLTQRSADSFLGIPYNIASYSFLTHMVAQQVNMVPGDFIWSGGDCHIYLNHIEQVKLQLSRKEYSLPTLKLNKAKDIFSYKYEDFEILNYQCHPKIEAEIAV